MCRSAVTWKPFVQHPSDLQTGHRAHGEAKHRKRTEHDALVYVRECRRQRITATDCANDSNDGGDR